ncbi:hypothetical protein Tco_0035671, partial [Tanacetum coccineum]
MLPNTSLILELFCNELKKLITHFIPVISLKLLVQHLYNYCWYSFTLYLPHDVQTLSLDHPIVLSHGPLLAFSSPALFELLSYAISALLELSSINSSFLEISSISMPSTNSVLKSTK